MTDGQTGGSTSGSEVVLRGTVGDPLGGQTAIQIAAGPTTPVPLWSRTIPLSVGERILITVTPAFTDRS